MLRAFAGRRPVVPDSSYVDSSAQVIGHVTLGEQSSVWMNAVLRGDVHSITVGARSNVQDNAVLHGQRGVWPVVVGNGVTIGHGAIVHGCVLEDDVLVGMGAIILNGARVGAGSIIAAGAVVTEGAQIPPGSLVAGVPGKVRRSLTSTDLDLIRAYGQNYVEYTAIYLGEAAAELPQAIDELDLALDLRTGITEDLARK
jgi:carbonic anhydrase/acetyltransferase-like protein (isoleucine patch superfamily)